VSPAAAKSLVGRGDPLASPAEQRRILADLPGPTFPVALAAVGRAPLLATDIRVLQVNVGRLCNQTCRHCHVDAGPDRREVMSAETAAHCLDALQATGASTLDVTGGAPELTPVFRPLVEGARALGRHVIDRCNLTVLLLPGQADLAAFLARHRVEVVASLPSFAPAGTDAQRGDGVYDASIRALRLLNELGYGRPGSGLLLNLVHNPVGAFLPPDQAETERRYRTELARRHGVVFDRLYTITNQPISRYLEYLRDSGNLEDYVAKLVGAFNPAAVDGLMCRTMLSVAWDGTLHDCDFNQMLGIGLAGGGARHVRDLAAGLSEARPIATGRHCFACTAGGGSSCGGATVAPGDGRGIA
jgi:radical SAM/Cys-rich protein